MKALAVLALTLVPFLAQAQVFVEGTLGQADVDLGSFAGVSVDDKDTTWSIGGGYMFNRNVGIEASYRDLGEVSLSAGALSGTAEADGFTLGIRGVLPVTPKLDLTGHFGFLMWDLKGRVLLNGALFATADDDGTDPYFGVGLYYNVTPQLGIGGGWSRYEVSDSDADVFDIRLKYNF